MTSTFPTAQVAAILVERRIKGIQGNRLPPDCRPDNVEAAFAIQDAVTEEWCERMDDTIGAWKCALPAGDQLIAAPIYTRTIDSVPPVALWPTNGRARIEPELAFFFSADLPPRPTPYSIMEIDAAIGRTHMALELIYNRYAEAEACEFCDVLADGLVNQGLYIGPAVDSGYARAANEFDIKVAGGNTETNVYHGKHPGGQPRAPLYWLVEFLRARGLGIEAGQAVITGSYAGVIEVPLGCDISIEFTGLGKMSVRFNAR